jgi:osmoprotectant transport system substrate-binding protein
VIPVAKKDIASNYDVQTVVNAISKKITTDDLIKLNKRFDVDKEDAAVIAKSFLQDKGLL